MWQTWVGGFVTFIQRATGLVVGENQLVAPFEADITVGSVFRRNSGSAADSSILVRGSDTNNFWLVRWVSATGTVSIVRRQAGADTVVASDLFAWDADRNYVIQVACSGANLTVSIDGSTVRSVAAASFNQTAVYAGMRAVVGALNTVTFDDFIVTVP